MQRAESRGFIGDAHRQVSASNTGEMHGNERMAARLDIYSCPHGAAGYRDSRCVSRFASGAYFPRWRSQAGPGFFRRAIHFERRLACVDDRLQAGACRRWVAGDCGDAALRCGNIPDQSLRHADRLPCHGGTGPCRNAGSSRPGASRCAGINRRWQGHQRPLLGHSWLPSRAAWRGAAALEVGGRSGCGRKPQPRQPGKSEELCRRPAV